MEIRDKALDLAQFLENHMAASILILGDLTTDHIITTIRQLVDELDKKKAILSVNIIASDADLNILTSNKIVSQEKQLSDDEIINLWHKAHGVKHGN